MTLRIWRVAALAALGTVLGLGWNAFSGRGFALDRNAFLAPGDSIEEITPAEARQRLDKGALFLDARPVDFYNMEHIPGALPLPEDDFKRAFAQLEPRLRSSFDIVVYCAGYGCEASHNVVRLLKERQVQAVVLQGGWPDWTEGGHPTKTGAEP